MQFPVPRIPLGGLRGFSISRNGVRRSALDLLAYPGVTMRRLSRLWPELSRLRPDVVEQLESDAGYVGYLDRQQADIRAYRRDEALRLPADLDFDAIPSLSAEVRSRLRGARPPTLGVAARLEGVTPAALVALLRYVKREDPRPSP